MLRTTALRVLRLQPWERNLYLIVVAELIGIMGFGISVPFLPFYIQELGVTRVEEVASWVGLISSTSAIAMAVASPIWGVMGDRRGRKLMLVRAMLGGGITMALMGAVSTVPQLVVLRILQGLLAGSVAAATTLVATSLPREQCGFGLGLLQTAIFAGHSLGPFVGGALAGLVGYAPVFLGSGAMLLAAGVVVAVCVREEFAPPPPREKGANPVAQTARVIVAHPVLATMLALLVLNNLSSMITTPILPLFVQTMVPDAKAASTATGMVVGATALGNAVAAVWIGRSADRIGRRRVLLTCLTVGALVYFPQMLTRHPAQLLALRLMMGMAMGGVIPVANAIIAERAPDGQKGAIYGISASLNAAGRALGPILGAVVVMQFGVAGVFPVTGTLLCLLAALAALKTRSLAGDMSAKVDGSSTASRG